MNTPTLAAISLAQGGGGVAVVARLLWDVFQREWGGQARLLRLIDGDGATRAQPTFAEKGRYALRLARAQMSASSDAFVYSHLGLVKPLAAVPRRARKPYSVFLHGIEVWQPLHNGHIALLAGATRRIANSAYTAARLLALHPEVGPVDPCPLGLPIDDATVPPDALDALPPLGPHAVLVVGRMSSAERYKGHDELIEVWPSVVSVVKDAQLVIAGGGDDEARLREKASVSRASRAIVFTGFVSRSALLTLYERCTLFALPSRAEGFGLVYLEAMAHGIACIGSIHDAAGDVIANGRTGLLVNQDDRDALAGAIVELLIDDERRLRMGREGHRLFLEQFTFDAFTERFLTLVGRAHGS